MSDHQLRSITNRLNKFAKRDVPGARITATNKALAMAKTRTVKAIVKAADVKAKAVRPRVKVDRAKGANKGALHVYRRAIPLIKLGARQNRKGVRAGKRFVQGGFIAQGRMKTAQVMRRKGRERLPVEVMRVEIRQHVDAIAPKTVRRAFQQNFNRLYQHEIKRRLSRG